jgi:arsenate reductase (thioredoxin)
MLKVLFVCTGNSCRSQMAEGWARRLSRGAFAPYSAGMETHALDPNAVRVMAEVGIDISGHRSKHAREFRGVHFDLVVTLSSRAQESPAILFGRSKAIHVAFESPPRLAAGARTEEECLAHYRRVRDTIREFVATLSSCLNVSTCPGGGGAARVLGDEAGSRLGRAAD